MFVFTNADMTSSVTSTTEEISTSESATTEETTVSLPLETSTVEETTVGNYTSEVTTDVTQTTETSTIEPNDQFQRTVIFLYEASTFSQNLFIRGAAENRAFVTIPINVKFFFLMVLLLKVCNNIKAYK